MLHINVYTSLHLHFFIYVWEHGTFFKNKRQKSLECVKNIISLHQLS